MQAYDPGLQTVANCGVGVAVTVGALARSATSTAEMEALLGKCIMVVMVMVRKV